ncbi:hypothetical protein F5890DRAFT_1553779 [Lentinula detonsa]|uniref:Uncharacterized protein n=1 Tax=Lentinula detonsa TaxID=2804962 RepID=A0AA38US36_9AGAR|nr:hypothetical protein F5890DRAFT_1553779 [Lentinula detonsa]
MLPRFANPHLVHIPTEKISRDDAFYDASSPESRLDSEDRPLLKELNKRLHDSLEFKFDAPRKQRKLFEGEYLHSSSDPTCTSVNTTTDGVLIIETDWLPTSQVFRLVSTAEEPRPININPPPPKPPPHYREPNYEDTEEDALKRRKCSKAVAVDYDWVIQESRKTHLPFPSWKSRLTHATLSPAASTSAVSSSSPVLILHHLQPLRHTRPPVSDELLTHHPYVAGAPPHPEAQSRRKSQSTIPAVEVMLQV